MSEQRIISSNAKKAYKNDAMENTPSVIVVFSFQNNGMGIRRQNSFWMSFTS